MDLEARVTALEDEVGILKGEIKSVLLEVRTAFLAQNNPFTSPQLMAPPAPAPAPTPPPAPAPAPETDSPAPAPIPAIQHIGSIQHVGASDNGQSSFGNNGGRANSGAGYDDDDAGYNDDNGGYQDEALARANRDQGYGNGHQAQRNRGPAPSRNAGPTNTRGQSAPSYGGYRGDGDSGPAYRDYDRGGYGRGEPEPVRRDPRPISRIGEPVFDDESPAEMLPAPVKRKFDMNTLAMLMAWAQGNMARLNLTEMGSLLALARYGGVIEAELEQILMHIARHFEEETDPRTGLVRVKTKATISEYLLALHELHTVLNEQEDTAFSWLRKVG
jgi:hypothetical protein